MVQPPTMATVTMQYVEPAAAAEDRRLMGYGGNQGMVCLDLEALRILRKYRQYFQRIHRIRKLLFPLSN